MFWGRGRRNLFGVAFCRFGIAGDPACRRYVNCSCGGDFRVAIRAMSELQYRLGAMVDGSPARRVVVALAARLLRMSRVRICLTRFGVSNPSNNRFERTRGIIFGEPRRGSMIRINQLRLMAMQSRVAQPNR